MQINPSDPEYDACKCNLSPGHCYICGKPSKSKNGILCGSHKSKQYRHGSPYITKNASPGSLIETIKKAAAWDKDECFTWPHSSVNGRPDPVLFQGRKHSAPRLVLYFATGEMHEDLNALHSCRNTLCIARTHLDWGTQAKNCGEDKFRDGTIAHGTKHGCVKLNEDQVVDIFHDLREQREIARDYGIDHSTVGSIQRKKTWKRLTADLLIPDRTKIIRGNGRHGSVPTQS